MTVSGDESIGKIEEWGKRLEKMREIEISNQSVSYYEVMSQSELIVPNKKAREKTLRMMREENIKKRKEENTKKEENKMKRKEENKMKLHQMQRQKWIMKEK